MGNVQDWFKPRRSDLTLCDVLMSNKNHIWSATGKDGSFRQPAYHSNANLLGGSATHWPSDGRRYLSFWGGNGANAGCCHRSTSDSAAWRRAFSVEIIP